MFRLFFFYIVNKISGKMSVKTSEIRFQRLKKTYNNVEITTIQKLSTNFFFYSYFHQTTWCVHLRNHLKANEREENVSSSSVVNIKANLAVNLPFFIKKRYDPLRIPYVNLDQSWFGHLSEMEEGHRGRNSFPGFRSRLSYLSSYITGCDVGYIVSLLLRQFGLCVTMTNRRW